jgi:sugar phosphate isomerase/epimerase
MKVGVFTALLSRLPLEEVLKKLKAFQIDTVELGTVDAREQRRTR